jgi:hypothetical protein
MSEQKKNFWYFWLQKYGRKSKYWIASFLAMTETIREIAGY